MTHLKNIRHRNTGSQQGFSLLELLVVVAIIGILSTIAYSSYVDQVIKSRRAAGAACLQERAQFMERYYTTNMSYADAPDPPACDAEVSPYYTVQFEEDPTARAFTLQAVPQGTQASRDTKCATLTLDQQGARGTTNTETTASECW